MRHNEPENENITYDALIRDYPELTGAEWLYANGWYDGPLDGMVTHSGRELYASILEEDDDGRRTYALRVLDEDSLAYERQKHADFCEFVGNHWSFEKNCSHEVKPQSEWHKFYDKYDWKTHRKLTGKLVGWMA